MTTASILLPNLSQDYYNSEPKWLDCCCYFTTQTYTFMKSIICYVALALVLGACSTGRYVVKGDEYDDVYLVSSDFQKAEVRKEQKITENGGLPSEAFNSEYDQKPISNYANPDAMDLPVGSNPNGVVYYPMDNQNANWNNYNSWNNIGWNDCWNCWGGGGWNSWNTPYYYNSWNRPWGWNNGWGVGMGYGWNTWNTPYYYSWNRPWGWNSWNNGWGWGGNTIIIDNRTPNKIQVAPRASAGRGSSFVRNTPNPRLQNNTNVTNPNNGDQSGRIANTTGGRTRNIATNTYTPTQSNEVRTGRIRNENTNNSGRYSTPSDSRGRDTNSGGFSGGRNSSNSNSWGSSGRSNDNSGSYGSGRSNNSSSGSSGSGRSSGSSSSGRSSSGSSGGRVGGRSPR